MIAFLVLLLLADGAAFKACTTSVTLTMLKDNGKEVPPDTIPWTDADAYVLIEFHDSKAWVGGRLGTCDGERALWSDPVDETGSKAMEFCCDTADVGASKADTVVFKFLHRKVGPHQSLGDMSFALDSPEVQAGSANFNLVLFDTFCSPIIRWFGKDDKRCPKWGFGCEAIEVPKGWYYEGVLGETIPAPMPDGLNPPNPFDKRRRLLSWLVGDDDHLQHGRQLGACKATAPMGRMDFGKASVTFDSDTAAPAASLTRDPLSAYSSTSVMMAAMVAVLFVVGAMLVGHRHTSALM